jgi:glycosyltransferase involved in cell wall biosynthesis
MNILQVAHRDGGGGAEKIARDLQQAYQQRGHDSWLAVREKHSDDAQVVRLHRPHRQERFFNQAADRLQKISFRGAYRLQTALRQLANPIRSGRRWLGHEVFEFPQTRHILNLSPQKPDVLHCHNLHGDYFDLRALPYLSHQIPTLLTLHDAWLLSGHCAHSFGCDRWLTGCGNCPDLTLYPAVRRDATAYNWRRKQAIFAQSRFTIVTPSQWLMDKVMRSMLQPAIYHAQVIHNGVNLAIFQPADKTLIREKLALPTDARILLFAAASIRRNVYKDFATMRQAVAHIAEQLPDENIVFIGLGDAMPPETIGKATIQFVPFQSDAAQVAQYYQAADIYLHAARADTFPTSVLEALACGVPVVASDVGGIPEQVRSLPLYSAENATGILVPVGEAAAMASAVLQLLTQTDLRQTMAHNARHDAENRFDAARMVTDYLTLYEKMCHPLNTI